MALILCEVAMMPCTQKPLYAACSVAPGRSLPPALAAVDVVIPLDCNAFRALRRLLRRLASSPACTITSEAVRT